MAKTGDFVKQLPPWAKGAIAVAVVVAVGGVAFAVYKRIKREVQSKDTKEEAKGAGGQLADLAKQGVNPTFTTQQAQAKANLLQKSADGCDPLGQGATEIMNTIYSCKNAADWYLLVNTFGNRTWADCGWGTVTGSLTTLLISELDTPQMKEARRHLGQFGVSV